MSSPTTPTGTYYRFLVDGFQFGPSIPGRSLLEGHNSEPSSELILDRFLEVLRNNSAGCPVPTLTIVGHPPSFLAVLDFGAWKVLYETSEAKPLPEVISLVYRGVTLINEKWIKPDAMFELFQWVSKAETAEERRQEALDLLFIVPA